MSNLFQHDDRVTLFIRGVRLDDAKIAIKIDNNKERRIFLCQNIARGFETDDKLGYKYSYELSESRSLNNDNIQTMNILGRKPTQDEIKFLETSYANDDKYREAETMLSPLI